MNHQKSQRRKKAAIVEIDIHGLTKTPSSFCELWWQIDDVLMRLRDRRPGMAYVEIPKKQKRTILSRLKSACEYLSAPELFGPCDGEFDRHEVASIFESCWPDVARLSVAGFRVPRIQDGCLHYAGKRGEICEDWEAAPPRSPINSVELLLEYLRGRWNELNRDRTSAGFDSDELVSSMQPALQNVWRTVDWLRDRGELSVPPFLNLEPQSIRELQQHVRRLEKWIASEIRVRTRSKTAATSNPKVKKAADYIREHGPVGGKDIAKHIQVAHSTFRSDYSRLLKDKFGIRNRRGIGYFIPNEEMA